MMVSVNSNEGLNETEGLVENILDDLIAEAESDDGPVGPLDPRPVLIEMAARALCRAVFDYGVMPELAESCTRSRMSFIMKEEIERSDAKLPPDVRLVTD